jgi:exosortase C (VPDSG-CTERM-specific)
MPVQTPRPLIPAQSSARVNDNQREYRVWVYAIGAIALAFAWPLYSLIRFALHDETQSHVIIVPLVSAYFVWLKRKELPTARRSWLAALLPLIAGAGCLAAYLTAAPDLPRENLLALSTSAFVLIAIGATVGILGTTFAWSVAFSIGFLVFMIPMPNTLVDSMESFLQHASAPTAHVMFQMAGTSVYRQDLLIRLPGITLEIAPECSGIRSTIALFITSVAAGQLFLRSRWLRIILAVSVIPLAIVRNGFRVFTIGELCVHISPTMIDSYIHHHGGPIFFALSLIPFAIMLKILIWLDSRRAGTDAGRSSPTNP